MNTNYQRAQSQIVIAKLILQATGTYNPIYSRPYQTHIDGTTLNNIVRRVDEFKGTAVTGSLFAGVASSILSPSATPQGEIPIHMGWTERRVRFFMEVHVTVPTGSSFIYYFQGYTSHQGVTETGNIDPQMEFYINSYIRVNRAQQYGPYGTITRDVVTESAHVINGQLVQQGNSYLYGMRPQDIFTGIQSGYLEQSYANHMNSSDDFKDFRFVIGNEPVRSSRANNLPSSFIAKVVDGYQTSRQLADFGQGSETIYGKSQHMVMEASPYENVFIRALSNLKGTHCTTAFSFRDLQSIDPNVGAVTNYIALGVTQSAQLHSAGQTSYWNGTDRETLAATTLSNAVPAIMMELMINNIYFRSTNHDQSGVANTVLISAKSLTNADISMNLELFKKRLEKELMFDITYGNSELYLLEMRADLFGDTTISISLGNGPMMTYTTPSFCDSLLTPVVTTSKDSYFGVVNDFEQIFNSLSSADVLDTSRVNTLV